MSDQTPLFEVEELRAGYSAGTVVHGISLSVMPGEIFCLLGRSGAGKTTTLRAIMRAGVHRSGSVRLRGREVGNLPTDRLACLGIAWVPDDRRIFSQLTVEQNLTVGMTAARRRGGGWSVDELCDQFELLKPLLKRRGDQLSGGQQQVVAVARAMASRPDVLLLDEPMEGLAPVVVDELVEIVRSLPEAFGVGIILVEENTSVARRLGDRAAVLRVGEVAYSGPMSRLVEDDDLHQSLLGLGVSDIDDHKLPK